MLKEGDKLPLFDRLNQKGEALNSEQFIGKKPLVVFFIRRTSPLAVRQRSVPFGTNTLTFSNTELR